LAHHVRFLLEVDSQRDMKKVTSDTRQPLAHIAIRNGDYALFATRSRARFNQNPLRMLGYEFSATRIVRIDEDSA
jgi:hypothetical protein